MGSSGSKAAKKINGSVDQEHGPSKTIVRTGYPFVLTRRGSMFFDEDEDLAHEFYIEVPSAKKGCKASMKKVLHSLTPQGQVRYKFPRLHVDFPVILCQGDLFNH